MLDKYTLFYYDRNAEQYYQNTVSLDLSDNLDRFLSHLPAAPHILDFGCGSGRDTKAFMEKGCQVDAVDGCGTLCRLASEHTGIPVRYMLFEDLSAISEYDGIWACASVMHLPNDELQTVMDKMMTAVKPGGLIYMSFKYGFSSEWKDERHFTKMTEERLADLIKPVKNLKIMDQWTTFDVRPNRKEEKWLHVILQKQARKKNFFSNLFHEKR